MKYLLFCAVWILLLTAQTCNPKPPPSEPVSAYCHGNDFSVLNNINFGYERDGVTGGLAAVLQGDPSDSIRGTVQVRFGQAYCTGVALSPTVVLTAGHCGYGATTDHMVNVYKRAMFADASGPIASPIEMRKASTKTGLPAQPGEETFAYNAAALSAAEGRLELVYSALAVKHTVHPDYLDYTQSGNHEKRKADLMVLHLREPLPDDVEPVAGFYDPAWAQFCNGGLAQGFGRWEGDYLDLRETKYVITSTSDPKALRSVASQVPDGEEHGRICFGDSGGPYYLDVGGQTYLGGVTTTTMSSDCMYGGTHVSAAYFAEWIMATAGDV